MNIKKRIPVVIKTIEVSEVSDMTLEEQFFVYLNDTYSVSFKTNTAFKLKIERKETACFYSEKETFMFERMLYETTCKVFVEKNLCRNYIRGYLSAKEKDYYIGKIKDKIIFFSSVIYPMNIDEFVSFVIQNTTINLNTKEVY